jgi:transcriptional regulator with XRE-family HTH domain
MNEAKPTIKQLREARNLTQPELAVKANLSVTTISRIENGRVRANKGILRLICNVLGVSPEEIASVATKR